MDDIMAKMADLNNMNKAANKGAPKNQVKENQDDKALNESQNSSLY